MVCQNRHIRPILDGLLLPYMTAYRHKSNNFSSISLTTSDFSPPVDTTNMVNMKMILTSSTQNESTDVQRIRLDPEQASKAPFPPGCPVVVLEKARILCSGEVTAVYVSFAHCSGSCDNCYEVRFKDPKGDQHTLIVRGDLLRYAMGCPINVSHPNGNYFDENDVIEGVIKGFELQSDYDNSTDQNISTSVPFFYTVEVSAAVGENQESLFRQRGIGQEHIRFRPSTVKPSYLQDVKTSVVSFDDTSATNAKDDCQSVVCNDKKHNVEKASSSPLDFLCSSPRFVASMNTSNTSQHNQNLTQGSTSGGESTLTRVFVNCTPLQSPIPNHFQGNMILSRNEKVPEFTFLVNFPSCNKQGDLPPGKRRCVMCGELRWASPINKNKGKNLLDNSAFIPGQNKGLCTICDVNIWVVNKTCMQIKWCKGCKNFQTWASFGDKGSATKCMRCRDRQREKYALSKKASGVKRKSLSTGINESKKRVN